MIIGFIIAAGKQTRFNSEKPKALAMFGDHSALDHNCDLMQRYCDEIYVVCSKYNKHYFEKSHSSYTDLIVVDPLLGCGDSIYRALKDYINSKNPNKNTTCIIHWGDSYQTEEVYNSIDFDNNKGIQVPCCVEKNPYVNFLTVGTKIVEVQFSKYGEIEKDTVGYHDCSLFYGNIYYIYEKCKEYYDTYFSEAGQNYISYNHGKDFNFLDIFNRFSASGYICELSGKAVKSFNTIDELSRVGGSI